MKAQNPLLYNKKYEITIMKKPVLWDIAMCTMVNAD
jgi:hypothetical protein